MATDATGTPTTNYSFPTYNTASDIPSGKGFDAAITDVDSKLASSSTLLGAVARSIVRKAGTLVGTRRAINFIEGTGVTITTADNAGTEAVDVTIASSGAISTSESALSGDVTIVNAGTYYDGPSVSLVAGTWLLIGHATFASGSAGSYVAKLWDGTTAVSSGETSSGSGTVYALITLQGIVTPSSTTSYKISGTSTLGSSTARLLAANDYGSGNHATKLTAIKIG